MSQDVLVSHRDERLILALLGRQVGLRSLANLLVLLVNVCVHGCTGSRNGTLLASLHQEAVQRRDYAAVVTVLLGQFESAVFYP